MVMACWRSFAGSGRKVIAWSEAIYYRVRVTAKLQLMTLFTRIQYGDCDQTRFLSSLGSHKFFFRRMNKHENNYKVDYQRLKDLS